MSASTPAPMDANGWTPYVKAPSDSLPRLFLCGGKVVQAFVDATGVLTVQHEFGWRKMRKKPTHWRPLLPTPETADGR